MSDGDNDIAEILAQYDAMMLMKIAFCGISSDELLDVLEKLGKVEINIGEGLTLLHQAAQFGRPELVEILLERGHSLECRTIHGETPLDQACWKGNVECAMLLIRKNADVDCQTNMKYTPLHRCAFYNHPRLASLLILAGANQKLQCQDGETAYACALGKENQEMIDILKPIVTGSGEDITGLAYATNNPKHPNFRPEARNSLFALWDMEITLPDGGTAGNVNDDE